MLVYHLIYQDTKQWDEPLLRVCFQPEDVSLILGLRPTKNHTLDGYAWNHTKSGIYLVKSGYDLIRRAKLAQNTDDIYHWILWYIWKARNDKIFNGKEIFPVDTLIHAKIEAESWRSANKPEVDEDAIDETTPILLTPLSLPDAQRFPICQVDASWIENGLVSGLGWSLRKEISEEIFGLQGCRRSLSALHAGLESLLWVMSCVRDRQIISVHF
ncbi:hypothetical protein EUTSA_v10017817mg [Eutrema salsugineum]|uniref:RNase H type-1 domain-containing protein n=1 Tax=Eutrema salsugineum TaxID=72664 RepID=V4MFD4_EUTSA|nr:hypothetical protein EUTSA_v10017817mg [Eutrema salsugineum]